MNQRRIRLPVIHCCLFCSKWKISPHRPAAPAACSRPQASGDQASVPGSAPSQSSCSSAARSGPGARRTSLLTPRAGRAGRARAGPFVLRSFPEPP